MRRPPDPNLARLEAAVAQLGELADELMLVGGCAAGLLVVDAGVSPVRPTRDVDLAVRVPTYVGYEQFGARLARRGFTRATFPDDSARKEHGFSRSASVAWSRCSIPRLARRCGRRRRSTYARERSRSRRPVIASHSRTPAAR